MSEAEIHLQEVQGGSSREQENPTWLDKMSIECRFAPAQPAGGWNTAEEIQES